jgi:zinc transporter, ZIP family
MLDSFLWGLLATSSLVIGGLLGSWLKIGNRPLGVIMAFGAGVLISAVAYELPNEAFRLATTIGFPAIGFFIGALTFFFSDILIEKAGAKSRKSIKARHSSDLVIPIVLATILDGIPESIVIGLSLLEGGIVSMSMLIAVFISNLPEAIAGTAGMKAGKWKVGRIFLVWLFIAIICALSSFAGYSLLGGVSDNWLAFIQAFAGGAIMVMLANTMIPEAYEHGGKLAGIFTVLGFAVSMMVAILEKIV